MAFSPLGSLLDRVYRNELNRMLKELYDNVFLFSDGSGFILNHHLADDSIGASKLRDGAVGNSKLAYRAATADKIAHGSIGGLHLLDNSVTPSKISTDSRGVNEGEIYPFINVGLDGVQLPINERVKDGILDVKISGAEAGKVYQLESVRNGLSGTYGITFSSYTLNEDGSIDMSSRKVEHNYNGLHQSFDNAEAGVGVMVAHSNITPGLSISVVFDVETVSGILNINENTNGVARGTIIDPSNYHYASREEEQEQNVKEDIVTVDKKSDLIKIFIPTLSGYVGYEIRRKTKPFEQGVRDSNVDVWHLSRISGYEKINGEFTERDDRVFLHSPALTQENVFRLVGETDYSGGAYHGDELLQSFKLIVGNADLTNDAYVGIYTGKTVELIQETLVHKDTFTSQTGDTESYLKVNKALMFDCVNGFTLKTRIETLSDITTEFSSIGAFQMFRKLGDGVSNNWTDVYDLTNMESLNVRIPDTAGNHFTGTGALQYKAIGYYKHCTITFDTDSDYFDTWVRNWADFDSKMYSRVFPEGELVPVGTVVKSSVNYNFTIES